MPGEIADPQTTVRVPAQPAAEAPNTLHVTVITGQGAINILSNDGAVQPVVQVSNKNNEPVGGVLVTFTSPSTGAGVVFLNGSRSIGVVTDATGRAGLVGMKPTGVGAFKLNVSAASQGQTVTTTISEANYATAAAASIAGAPGYAPPSNSAATGARPAGLSTRAKGGIIAGIAGAAAIGVIVALSHGGSSSSSTSAAAVPTASIGLAGSPTTGAPH